MAAAAAAAAAAAFIKDPVGFFFFHDTDEDNSLFCVVPRVLLFKDDTTLNEDEKAIYRTEINRFVYAVRFGSIVNLPAHEFRDYLKKRRYEVLPLDAEKHFVHNPDEKLIVAQRQATGEYQFVQQDHEGERVPLWFAKKYLAAFLVGNLCRTNDAVFNAQFTFLDYLACHTAATNVNPAGERLEIKFKVTQAVGQFEQSNAYSWYLDRNAMNTDDSNSSELDITIPRYDIYSFLAAFKPPAGKLPLFFMEKEEDYLPSNAQGYDFEPMKRGFAYKGEVIGFRKLNPTNSTIRLLDLGTSSSWYGNTQYLKITDVGDLIVTGKSFLGSEPSVKLNDVVNIFVANKMISNEAKNGLQQEVDNFVKNSSDTVPTTLFVLSQFVLDQDANVFIKSTKTTNFQPSRNSVLGDGPENRRTLTPFKISGSGLDQYFFTSFQNKLSHNAAVPAANMSASTTDSPQWFSIRSNVFAPQYSRGSMNRGSPPASRAEQSEAAVISEFEADKRAAGGDDEDAIADQFRDMFEHENGADRKEEGQAEEEQPEGERGDDDARRRLVPHPREGPGPHAGPEPSAADDDDDFRGPPADLPVGIGSDADLAGARRADTDSGAAATTDVRRASARDIGDQLSMMLFYGVPFFVPLFFVFNSVIEQDFKGVVYLLGLMATLVLSYAGFLMAEYLWSVADDLRGRFRNRGAPRGTVGVLAENAAMFGSSALDRGSSSTTQPAASPSSSSSSSSPVAAAAPNTCIRVIVGATDYAREMNIALVVLAYTFMYLLSCAVLGNVYEDGFADFPRYAAMFTLFLALALHNLVVSSSLPSCRANHSADGSFGKYTTDALSVSFGAILGYASAACVHAMGVPELLYYGPRSGGGVGGGGGGGADGAKRCVRTDGTTVWCK